jgi:choline dehydrogenase-like flavoprotein
MKSPIGGPFASRNGHHMLGPLQTVDREMRRFADGDEVDVVVVGVGSAGGVLVQRLARAGLHVVGIEAGPFWDTERDWVSDEAGSHKLYWTAARVVGGKNPIALGANNSGHGVGGGSVHWAGFTPRFHPSDFRIFTDDGVGADWPLTYADLRPYYEILEREIPVSGPAHFPWGDPHGYTYGPHPSGEVTNVLVRGCTKLGIRVVAGGPVAINAGAHADRPHCIYRGFCIQGCKVGAKQSTLVSHVPDAIDHGAEIRAGSMVSRIAVAHGRVTGVHYFDVDGQEHFQRARLVIVSGYAIETPRLLLNSACADFPDGLANSSGTVGKYLMVQDRPLSGADPNVQGASGKRFDGRVLRDRCSARIRARLRHPDRGSAADQLREDDDDREGRLGLGNAARDDGLQSLGGPRRARRAPSLGRQPRDLGG